MGAIILAVTTITAAVVFSVQNTSSVAISFLFWRFDVSLDLVIFVALLVGMMNGAVFTSLRKLKRSAKDDKLKNV